jgi:E3 ubiquitin-protein ligase UBR4
VAIWCFKTEKQKSFDVSRSGNISASEWSSALAEWVRHNDDALLKSTSKLLTTFQEDLLPATSVDEIADVCGLLDDIPSPASFLLEVLAMVP